MLLSSFFLVGSAIRNTVIIRRLVRDMAVTDQPPQSILVTQTGVPCLQASKTKLSLSKCLSVVDSRFMCFDITKHACMMVKAYGSFCKLMRCQRSMTLIW